MADRSIVFDIKANTQNLVNSLNRTNQKIEGFGKNINKLGALIGGAFAVERIFSFGAEVFKLAEGAIEVKNAFNRLNDPNLLGNLKASTQGAVSELTLMQKAVSAKNLGIPIQNLAILFEFATKRAAETGESVDSLVDSIVTGIGRKSSLVLDNLGIVMSTAGKTVSEVAEEVTKLAHESLAEMGTVGVNATDKVRASFEDLKVTIGNLVLNEGTGVLNWLDDVIDKTNEFIKGSQLENFRKELEFSRKELEKISGGGRTFSQGLKTAGQYATELEQKINTLETAIAKMEQGSVAGPSPVGVVPKGLNLKRPELQGLDLPFIERSVEGLSEMDKWFLSIEQHYENIAVQSEEFNRNISEADVLMGDLSEEKIVDLRDYLKDVGAETGEWLMKVSQVQGAFSNISGLIDTIVGKQTGLSKGLSLFGQFLGAVTSIASLASPIGAGEKITGTLIGQGSTLLGVISGASNVNTSLGASGSG